MGQTSVLLGPRLLPGDLTEATPHWQSGEPLFQGGTPGRSYELLIGEICFLVLNEKTKPKVIRDQCCLKHQLTTYKEKHKPSGVLWRLCSVLILVLGPFSDPWFGLCEVATFNHTADTPFNHTSSSSMHLPMSATPPSAPGDSLLPSPPP